MEQSKLQYALKKQIYIAPEHNVKSTKISKNDTVFCEIPVPTKPLIERLLYEKSTIITIKKRFFYVFFAVFSTEKLVFYCNDNNRLIIMFFLSVLLILLNN